MLNKHYLFSAVLLLLQNGLLAVPVNLETPESIEVNYEEVKLSPKTTYTASSVTSPVYTTILPPYPTTIIAGYSSKPTGGTYSGPNGGSESVYSGYKSVSAEVEEDCEVEDDDYGDKKPSDEDEYESEVDDYSSTPEVPYKEKEEYTEKPEYSEKDNDDAKTEEYYDTEAYKSDEKVDDYSVKPTAKYPTSPNQNNYLTDNGEEEGHWECKWVKVPKKPSNNGAYLKRRFKAPMRRARRADPIRWPMMMATARKPTTSPMRRRRSTVYPHARMR